MNSRNRTHILLALFVGLAAVLILTGTLAVAPAGAQPPEKDPSYKVVFADTAPVQISDLTGAVVGEGTQLGKLMCNTSNCSQKVEVEVTYSAVLADLPSIEYKFATRLADDPVERLIVVAGTGRLSSEQGKEWFSFTAAFHDNRDGTVTVRYEASRPDASFIITAPGSFVIETRPQ